MRDTLRRLHVARRAIAMSCAIVGSLLACKVREPPSSREAFPSVAVAHASVPSPAASDVKPAQELTWTFAKTPVGRMRVVVLLPERKASERFPVLITMHGRGEALKGADRGARGWVDDYRLPRAIDRLKHPPLGKADFLGFVEQGRLAMLNESLAAKPYKGLIVVCPYTPDMLPGDDPFPLAPPLARFLVEELLPRVHRETPSWGTARATGIDGVSLGGRAAVAVGLLKPEAFGAISSLQAALDSENAADIANRLRTAREKNAKLKFRFVTSSGDYYLRPLTTIAKRLKSENIEHEFLVVPGPHDYDFNRGPGAIEMLLFHDRVLRDGL